MLGSERYLLMFLTLSSAYHSSISHLAHLIAQVSVGCQGMSGVAASCKCDCGSQLAYLGTCLLRHGTSALNRETPGPNFNLSTSRTSITANPAITKLPINFWAPSFSQNCCKNTALHYLLTCLLTLNTIFDDLPHLPSSSDRADILHLPLSTLHIRSLIAKSHSSNT
jgi:hypothetical protein